MEGDWVLMMQSIGLDLSSSQATGPYALGGNSSSNSVKRGNGNEKRARGSN